jgi:hypothetical protein
MASVALDLAREKQEDEARQMAERAQSVLRRAWPADRTRPVPGEASFLIVCAGLAGCSADIASVWIGLGDHARAARTFDGLLPLIDRVEDAGLEISVAIPGRDEIREMLTAERVLVACAALAERDRTLSHADRNRIVHSYSEQARAWLLHTNRAADRLVTLCLKSGPGPRRAAAEIGESLLAWVEVPEGGQSHAAKWPHVYEARLKACHLVTKIAIKKAMETPGGDSQEYILADFLSSAPVELRAPDLALKLARRCHANAPGNAMYGQSLGWALYRVGDWKGCLETLEKNANDEKAFVLAMAHWRLGNKAEAKAHLARGSDWLKGYEQRVKQDEEKGVEDHPSPSMLKRFQAEAAAMILGDVPKSKSKTSPQSKEDPIKLR